MRNILIALVLIGFATPAYSAWPVCVRNLAMRAFMPAAYEAEQRKIEHLKAEIAKARSAIQDQMVVRLERIFELANYDERVVRDLEVKVEAYYQALGIITPATFEASQVGMFAVLSVKIELAILKAFDAEKPDTSEYIALRKHWASKLPKFVNKKDQSIISHIHKLITYRDYVDDKLLDYNDFEVPVYYGPVSEWDSGSATELTTEELEHNRLRHIRNYYIDRQWLTIVNEMSRRPEVIATLESHITKAQVTLREFLSNPQPYILARKEWQKFKAELPYNLIGRDENTVFNKADYLFKDKKTVMKYLFGGETLNSDFENAWQKVEAS